MKVFLGGTCESNWREKLKKGLTINYYDPTVDMWSEKHKDREFKQREDCDILCYVISPKMEGVYSIAEAIDDSNKAPYKVVFMFMFMDEGSEFTRKQLNSLMMTGHMIEENGGRWIQSGNLQDLCDTLNHF